MNRRLPWAALAIVVVLGLTATLMRTCRLPADVPPASGLRPDGGAPPEAPVASSLDPVAPPPPSPLPPERLRPYLERLGRALLLRDGRRLAEALAVRPDVGEGDVDLLAGRLRDDLFVAAGAADLLSRVRPQKAVAAMAEVLAEPGRTLLKDVLVDTLARTGGDGALTALLGALKDDADDSVRWRCAKMLGLSDGPEAYAAIVQALRDPSPRVRSEAARAMGDRRVVDVLRTLGAALWNEEDPRIQADLFESIHRALDGKGRPRQDLARAASQLPTSTQAELERRDRCRFDHLLTQPFPQGFFQAGGRPVPFDPVRGRRIGVTVETGPAISLAEVGAAIFTEAPFDRYREWFYFRRAEEFPASAAYDATGQRMGDVARSELDGTVYLRFREPDHFQQGVLGYARGCEAFVQRVSLLHETGHALAGLGDEYARGSPPPQPNVCAVKDVPWSRLVRDSHLPAPVLREPDVWIPAADCHMNNRGPGERDFCPVCQLALLGRIAELTGAPLP